MAKSLSELSATEIQKLYDKRYAVNSAVGKELIAVGRGNERIQDTHKLSDPIAVRHRETWEAFAEVRDEIEARKRNSGTLKPIRRARWL